MKTAIAVLVALSTCFAFAATPKGKKNEMVVTPPPTGNSFRAVLARTYTEWSTVDEGGGVTSFAARFPAVATSDMIFGERDAFRKITFFTSGRSTMGKYSDRTLLMYISTPDCKMPVFFLKPRIFSQSWLFPNRVAVLADGDLVLDESLAQTKPTREIYPGGVEETASISLNDAQLAKLRKVAAAKSVNVRITGEKGYVSLDRKTADAFKSDIEYTVQIYDHIAKLVAAKAYDAC